MISSVFPEEIFLTQTRSPFDKEVRVAVRADHSGVIQRETGR